VLAAGILSTGTKWSGEISDVVWQEIPPLRSKWQFFG